MHALSLLLSLVVAAGDDPSPADNEEWIARDIAVARRIVACLPPGQQTASEWLRKLAPSDDERVDLGHGGVRHDLACYGGYTTTWISLVIFDDRIASIDVRNPLEENEVGPVGKALAPIWKPHSVLTDKSFRYRYQNPQVRAAFDRRLATDLGPITKIAIPAEYRQSYELLTSPASDLAFGRVCGYAGVPPRGRQEIQQLVTAKQIELIRNVLRCPNPVGRVYAASVLLELQKQGTELAPADLQVIEKIRRSPVKIKVCSGCTYWEEPCGKALLEERNRVPR